MGLGGTDIRINSLDNSLTLTYLGVITQTTDEDWKDARLVCVCVWRCCERRQSQHAQCA